MFPQIFYGFLIVRRHETYVPAPIMSHNVRLRNYVIMSRDQESPKRTIISFPIYCKVIIKFSTPSWKGFSPTICHFYYRPARLCFHRLLWFCSQGGGGVGAVWHRYLPQGDTPLCRHPSGQTPPGQTPLGRSPGQTPGETPLGQTTPGRHPSGQTAPFQADTPLLGRRLLLQTVHILLECILVFLLQFISKIKKYKMFILPTIIKNILQVFC